MKNRKIPMRTCVVSKERYPKKELIRVVKTPDNEVIIDFSGRANGRGAYLKKDLDVFKKAVKTKVLEKHLEIAVPNNIYEELQKMI